MPKVGVWALESLKYDYGWIMNYTFCMDQTYSYSQGTHVVSLPYIQPCMKSTEWMLKLSDHSAELSRLNEKIENFNHGLWFFHGHSE